MSERPIEQDMWMAVALRKNYSWNAGPLKVRVSKEKPRLEADEVLVKVQLRIPPAVFRKPAFEVIAEVPGEAVVRPEFVVQVQALDGDGFAALAEFVASEKARRAEGVNHG